MATIRANLSPEDQIKYRKYVASSIELLKGEIAPIRFFLQKNKSDSPDSDDLKQLTLKLIQACVTQLEVFDPICGVGGFNVWQFVIRSDHGQCISDAVFIDDVLRQTDFDWINFEHVILDRQNHSDHLVCRAERIFDHVYLLVFDELRRIASETGRRIMKFFLYNQTLHTIAWLCSTEHYYHFGEEHEWCAYDIFSDESDYLLNNLFGETAPRNASEPSYLDNGRGLTKHIQTGYDSFSWGIHNCRSIQGFRSGPEIVAMEQFRMK